MRKNIHPRFEVLKNAGLKIKPSKFEKSEDRFQVKEIVALTNMILMIKHKDSLLALDDYETPLIQFWI